MSVSSESMVVIIRGIIGAGKTTLGERIILDSLEEGVLLSADDCFQTEDGYKFDPLRVSESHATCFRRFMNAVVRNVPYVVVANTFIETWEYQNYVDFALAMGCNVEIVSIEPNSVEQAREWANRNVHGVPAAIAGSMLMRYQKTVAPRGVVITEARGGSTQKPVKDGPTIVREMTSRLAG